MVQLVVNCRGSRQFIKIKLLTSEEQIYVPGKYLNQYNGTSTNVIIRGRARRFWSPHSSRANWAVRDRVHDLSKWNTWYIPQRSKTTNVVRINWSDLVNLNFYILLYIFGFQPASSYLLHQFQIFQPWYKLPSSVRPQSTSEVGTSLHGRNVWNWRRR